MQAKRGFTLIELLIVIGVLAVLATVTVLVLNPAELFRQARDSQRISDLNALKQAVGLYLSSVTNPNLENNGAGGFTCAANFGSDKPGMANPFALVRTLIATPGATTSINGTGWVRVNFTSMTTLGSPISILPRDPNATDLTLYYAYGCDQASTNPLTFEINARMESVRYRAGGANDAEGTDGGNQATRYEVGNYPALAF